MTKTDYIKIAKVIGREKALWEKFKKQKSFNKQYIEGAIVGIDVLSKKVVEIFKADNEKFMKKIFKYMGE